MRPNVFSVTEFKILVSTEWIDFDIEPGSGLIWADKIGALCQCCPLACHPHPMVKDDEKPGLMHKLCTLTVIKAGFLKLDQINCDERVKLEVINILKWFSLASPPEESCIPTIPEPIATQLSVIERAEPNKYGVFENSMGLHISMAKNVKVQLTICVACSMDGKYYVGCDCHYGSGGHSSPCSINGESFESLAAAVMSEVYKLREDFPRWIETKQIKGGGEKILSAINEFARPYEAELEKNDPAPADPEPEAAQPASDSQSPPVSRPVKPVYICGWQAAQIAPGQLYVVRSRRDWGVTRDVNEATKFKSVDAILAFYRSFGAETYGAEAIEANIYGGQLQIFQHGPAGLRQIPRLTRQTSIFDDLPELETVESQPDLIPSDTLDCFSRDEKKLLRAGYALIRYDRDNKTLQQTWDDHRRGWAPPVLFNTFAAAERSLKETLALDCFIEVTLDGDVNRHSHPSSKKLFAAGFDFYRMETWNEGTYRIKSASKNWGTWKKYDTPEECEAGWGELMKDEKALKG